MKKLITILAFFAAFAFNMQAQSSFTRSGNTFKSVSVSSRATKDTLRTPYFFEDSKGNRYNIIINKANGRCWVWKKSSKTGRLYKMYMKPEMAREISKLSGVTYKEK